MFDFIVECIGRPPDSVGGVLHRSRSTFSAKLHIEVQGDNSRSSTTPGASRMPQRFTARRSPSTVSVLVFIFDLMSILCVDSGPKSVGNFNYLLTIY